MSKIEMLSWKIVLREDIRVREANIPEQVLTIAPAFQHDNMPLEVSLLLPTSMGPRHFLKKINQNSPVSENAILGLFLNDPLLNITTEKSRLRQSGFQWIANLPSVEQQDHEFAQQLSDVGIDRQREFDLLDRLKSEDFKIAVVVSDSTAIPSVVKIDPDIIIVIPKVSDFAAGFPSPRQRSQAALDVFHASQERGWSGILLGFGDHSEIDHERLWPNCVHGLLCRPLPALP